MNLSRVSVALLVLLPCSAFAVTDDQVFAYAAANFPSLFSGAVTAGQYQQYDFRYYAGSKNYLAVDSDGTIFLLGPYTGGALKAVGTVASFANTIIAWNTSQATLTGIAATGRPLVSATVTLKDSAGHSQTATTQADGSYSFSVAGLSAPYLLKVNAGSNALYSYASATDTIANLNPYTGIVMQAYYSARGSDVATAFGGTLSASSLPTTSQLAMLVAPIVTNLQPYLINASVANPAGFSPFTAAVTANGAGFDRVLDRTTLSSGNAIGFTVDNGSGSTAGDVSSSVTLTPTTSSSNNNTASIAVNIKTSSGSVVSTAQQTVPVGTTSTQQSNLEAAQSGVLALFDSLRQLLASKGSNITVSDLTPYVDANYLNQGKDQSYFVNMLLGALSGLVPAGSTSTIYRTNKFTDGSTRYLDATIQIKTADALIFLDENDNISVGMVFKQAPGGSWKFYGQQTTTNAHVSLQQERNYSGNNTTNSLGLQASINVTKGSLSAASVSGPANSLPASQSACNNGAVSLTQSSVALVKQPGSYNGGDRYDLPCGITTVSSPPAAGTVYTFTMTPTGGTAVTASYPLNTATNDNGNITTIDGVSRASFAAANTASTVAGRTLTVTFTPPTTYPVLYSWFNGYCQNANEVATGGGSDFPGTLGYISPTTNSGTITVPTQCDGAPPANINIGVWFAGANGEKSLVNQILLKP